jgi:RNA polymerase sigma-70 factor (ECF subfamily)
MSRRPFKPFRSKSTVGLGIDEFTELYDREAEVVLRYFARRTLDPEVAFDLTAETFAKAFASRQRFVAERGNAAAWLFGIAHHELGSYLRRQKVERRARDRLGIQTELSSAADYDRIEATIDYAAIGRRLGAALRHLPNDQRDAVVYRVVDQLSYEQIAEAAGCSPQTARARVSRGLRVLALVLTFPDDHIQAGSRNQ